MSEQSTDLSTNDTSAEEQAAVHKAALDRVNLENTGTPTKEPSTDLLAGKYKTSEELLKGVENARNVLGLEDKTLSYIKDDVGLAEYYQDLDKQISQGGHKPAATVPPEGDSSTEDSPAKVDVDRYTAEYIEHGKLSPESYEELTKAGYAPELVDRLITAEQALADQKTQSLMDELGGQEQWNQTLAWAETALAPVDKTQLNLDLKDPDKQVEAAKALSEFHRERTGWAPKTVLKGGREPSPTGAQDIFSNDTEMIRAMGDPLYKTSPDYRAKMAEKIQRSRLAGTLS